MKSAEELILFARRVLKLSEATPLEISPLEGRGSERAFFRIKWYEKDSAILIHYDPKREENTYYAEIASFLNQIEVSSPRLIRHDPNHCLILMEDLGEEDLFSLRKGPWEDRKDLYQKTLLMVQRLHSVSEKDFPSGRIRLMPGFDQSLYQFEQDYFKEHFVKGVCGIELESSFLWELEKELEELREHLLEGKTNLIHRDLQSQNVMVRDGEPYLIDFQGMRFGNPLYDLGSLLCDPYVEFNEAQRMELLHFYYCISKRGMGWEDFLQSFWEASTQRLMQALGAYGFLGLKKRLKSYLDHIPRGLHLLHIGTTHVPFLPRLQVLTLRCMEVIGKSNGEMGFKRG